MLRSLCKTMGKMRKPTILLFIASLALSDMPCASQTLPIKPARTIRFKTEVGSYMNVDISPDGHTLAFDLLGDLYYVSASGGKAKRFTRGIALHLRPVWSPDGSKIAYITDESGTMQLSVSNLTGRYHRIFRKSDGALFEGLDAVWTPDSRKIAIGDLICEMLGGRIISKTFSGYPLRFLPGRKQLFSLDSGKIYNIDQTTNRKRAISGVLQGFQAG